MICVITGECGGAMETSRCPECNCEVGGTRHALNSSNTIAKQFLAEIEQLQPGHTQPIQRGIQIPQHLLE